MTDSLANLKGLLDEVVKGNDLEWTVTGLKTEAFSNASKSFSPYEEGRFFVKESVVLFNMRFCRYQL